ncbi:hypothetical protein PAECIP111893_03104 [Paenibacillus plantiphilus]|uniref:ABC transporter permease n=1 Tax=Paenibacillus plantiphilus TaxID=2905650 RepID=A0ABN8GNH6_9BACL|nr:hypothetical protein [Paenibacillus plantiphilus]CAH1209708.1 hypothetical protein PAECIP111893_03104 [Paenibacillus plantiphilus]
MGLLGLNLKLVSSSLVWAAAGIAVLQVLIVLLLEPWQIVEKTELLHIERIYEYMFPLVAIFVMSQLFAEELEPEVSGWLMSLPFRSWKLLLYRYLLGMGMLAVLYLAGIMIIHYSVLPIPLQTFTYHVLPPALWLGHLAMLSSLIGRSDVIGLGVPMFYWVLETLTTGIMTGELYLFSDGFQEESAALVWNRNMLLALCAMALILSLLVFARRSYYIRR